MSPDGSKLASTVVNKQQGKSIVYVWDLMSWQSLAVLEVRGFRHRLGGQRGQGAVLVTLQEGNQGDELIEALRGSELGLDSASSQRPVGPGWGTCGPAAKSGGV